MIDEQPWKPPYELVELAPEKARLMFPANWFSATIIGDHIQLSISTDAAGLDAVKARLQVLIEFAKLGPMPRSVISQQSREMELGDIAQVDTDPKGEDAKQASCASIGSAVAESDAPTPKPGDQ